MIISDTSRSQFLIKFLLDTINKEENEKIKEKENSKEEKTNKESSFLLGSHFDSDLKSEKYTASILQRIQVSMKYGEIIVMNNLESIYPSLYDLFNQSFTQVCGRKYARITIGSSTDALFEVDKDFKCIVLVDPKKLDQQDRPFLNRFEKQLFSFQNLLKEKENEIAVDIYKTLKEAVIPNVKADSKKSIKIDFSNHLVNFSLEEIRAIVYNNREKNDDEIKNEIYKKIVPTFSQDIMVNMNYSDFSSNNPGEFKKIVEIYKQKPNNFEKFLETLKNKNQSKNIIFTFSRIFDGLIENESSNNNNIISNNTLNNNISNNISNNEDDSLMLLKDPKNYSIRIIDKNDSEILLDEFIDKFYQSDKKIMIIQLKKDLSEHLNHIQNLIDNYNKNMERLNDTTKNQNSTKHIIIIIHLRREIFYSFESKNKDNNFISHLSPYEQIFIDNLKGKDISITELFGLSNEELFNGKIFDNEFENLIYQGFMRFSYKFLNEYKGDKKITETNYHEQATSSLKYNDAKEFLTDIQNRIIVVICNNKKNNTIISEIIKDSDYQQKGIDFISDIKNYMRELLLKYFIKFIYKTEKDAVLPEILFPTNKIEIIKVIKKIYIQNVEFGTENPSYDIRSNTVNIIFGLNIPLIYPYIYNKLNFASTLREDYIKYELKQKIKKIKPDELEKKDKLIIQLQEQFNDNNIFKKTNKQEISEQEMDIFYQDFRTIFIFENMKPLDKLDEILKIILEIKFGDYLHYYDRLGEVFLWIESYTYFIIDILKFYLELEFDSQSFKEIVSEKVNDRIKNAGGEEFEMIKCSEPFYSIIEYLTYYCIEHPDLFKKKIGTLDYCCELLIQNIQKYYITSRVIFLLKNCIEVYKYVSENINFDEYVKEIKEEMNNLKQENEKDLKKNLDNEFELIKNELPKNSDLIITFFILKYRQSEEKDIEYRKYLVKKILNDEKLLPYSQRFFFYLFSRYFNLKVNMNLVDEQASKNKYLIFNESPKNEIIYKLEEIIKKNDNKAKTLIEILLYYFNINISFSDSDLEDYFPIMKFIMDAIDGDELKINFIVYPFITRIYASAFYQKYIELFMKVKLDDNQRIKVPEFQSLFKYRKKLWQCTQIFMLKFLYFVKANKDFSQFKKFIQNEKISIYFEDIIIEKEDDINQLLEINNPEIDNSKESIYYRSLIMPQKFLDLEKSKEYISKNENKYPILSTYFDYKKKLEKGKSFLYKLNNIVYINDFENPLLHYYNFIERISRKDAKKKTIENEIERLKDKIMNIKEKFERFKKIWNEDFSNVTYEIEDNKKQKIQIIKSSSILEDFLLNNKKENTGRQIGEIYKVLIKEQNDFIEAIIEKLNEQTSKESSNIAEKDEINYLLQELKLKENKEIKEDYSINVQNATERQIINIKKINVENFKTIENLIYGFSRKKYLEDNSDLNFEKYNEYETNYKLIEENLRKCILYGKKSFNDKLNYIIYQAEADEQFSSNLNELLSKCDGKYELLDKEKLKKIDEFEDLSNILPSLDQLIFYINHSSSNDIAEAPIQDYLTNAKKVAKFSEEFNKLINLLPFKVKELAPLYDYIEEKTFPETKEKAKKQEYMKELGKGAIGYLIKNDLKDVLNKNKVIKREQLLRALRKFTIKYLLTDEQSISLDERLLDSLLNDNDLWLYQKKNNKSKVENERFEDMQNIKKILESEGLSLIMVKHTILFYEKLSGENIDKKYKKITEKEKEEFIPGI